MRLVVLARCQTVRHQPCWRGALSAGVTSTLYVDEGQNFGRLALLLTSHNHTVCGGRGSVPSADIDASTLHQFFDDKVAGVRAATADAPAAQYMPAPVRCELRLFTPVTPTEVAEMVRALPDKQCLSDPLPTWTLRASVDNLALLLVTRARCCSVEDEDCAHNAGTKED